MVGLFQGIRFRFESNQRRLEGIENPEEICRQDAMTAKDHGRPVSIDNVDHEGLHVATRRGCSANVSKVIERR
jgi:hypothetical protein